MFSRFRGKTIENKNIVYSTELKHSYTDLLVNTSKNCRMSTGSLKSVHSRKSVYIRHGKASISPLKNQYSEMESNIDDDRSITSIMNEIEEQERQKQKQKPIEKNEDTGEGVGFGIDHTDDLGKPPIVLPEYEDTQFEDAQEHFERPTSVVTVPIENTDSHHDLESHRDRDNITVAIGMETESGSGSEKDIEMEFRGRETPNGSSKSMLSNTEVSGMYDVLFFDDEDLGDKWKNTDVEKFEEGYKNIKNKWFHPFQNRNEEGNSTNMFQLFKRNFQLESSFSKDKIERNTSSSALELVSVKQAYESFDRINELDEEEGLTYGNVISLSLETMYYAKKVVEHMSYCLRVFNTKMPNDNIEATVGMFCELDYSKLKPNQKYIDMLLNLLFRCQYRRYNDSCFEKIYNKSGKFMYSWREVMTIKDFVHKQMGDRHLNADNWINATSNPTVIKQSIEYLKMCVDEPQFPELRKNRHMFSFQNGVYVTYYDPENRLDRIDRFYSFDGKYQPDARIASANFFKTDFDPNGLFDSETGLGKNIDSEEWCKIETPNFDKILKRQFEFESEYEDIKKWVYVVIGRMLYNIGECDKWQIFPYFQGVAGTGKGTLLKIPTFFYHPSDVGLLENNQEKTFGVAPLARKKIFVAPELTRKLSFDQAVFQKMISGEGVSIAIKNKDPVNIDPWLTPGAGAGNESIYQDNSGSIARRFFVILFNVVVPKKDSDPQLDDKLKANVANLLLKCNRAYLWAVNQYANQDIWKVVPNFFREVSQKISAETNHVKGLLMESGVFEFHDDYICSEADFKHQLNLYCMKNNIGRVRIPESCYYGPFSDVSQIEGVKIQLVRYKGEEGPDGKRRYGKHIRGIRVRSFESENTNE